MEIGLKPDFRTTNYRLLLFLFVIRPKTFHWDRTFLMVSSTLDHEGLPTLRLVATGHMAWAFRRSVFRAPASWRGNSRRIEAVDFKNTGLAESTPCGTVCLEVGPQGVHICDAIVLSANQKGSKVSSFL